jgi:hypothetical protein
MLHKQTFLEVIIVTKNHFVFVPPPPKFPHAAIQECLIKFGYRAYMKVEEILFLLWLPAGTCCRNLANLEN